MPGELDEKSPHIKYLKEFRTQQCPDFLQHKCSHHRPYNCFNWHFLNQKRRRPFKKKDGVFNYNPDLYCPRYDETTGVCSNGDECNLLHRVAGDVERRYHPRYFKTCICVHETDSKGHCVKNGPHCAYAHGPDDLRQPVFDSMEDTTTSGNTSINLLASHLEKDILHNEDPAWNDPRYVLINYKTEQCLRPHRLCRQGYACPSFHNPRDKRRSPKIHKYRSTPCPNVKRGDEWGDPPLCEAGDNCSYCHTRTEQQFHPEIYKSTKCNDMVQTGYCPRGQFCAFAHLERELSESWDVVSTSDTYIADYVEAAMPTSTSSVNIKSTPQEKVANGVLGGDVFSSRKSSLPAETEAYEAMGQDVFNTPPVSLSYLNQPEPIGKRRTLSLSEGSARYTGNNLGTVPERHPLQLKSNFMPLNQTDPNKDCLNQWAFTTASTNNSKNSNNTSNNTNTNTSNTINNNSGSTNKIGNAQSYYDKILNMNYPPEDTVESVIVNALEGDVGDLNLKEDQDSVNYLSFGSYFNGASRPVKIPNSSNSNNNSNNLFSNNSLSNSFLGSSIGHKDSMDNYPYGRSYPLLAPIGSEHAASIFYDKQQQMQSSTSTLTERPFTQPQQQSRLNNTFFPSGSLSLSPGLAGQMAVGNMMDAPDVLEALTNENRILRLEMEKLSRQLEQMRNDRDALVFKLNSVMNELSILKNSPKQHMQQQLQQQQQQHLLQQQQLLQQQLQQPHMQQQQGVPSNEAGLIFNDVQQLGMDPNAQMAQYTTSNSSSVPEAICSVCKQRNENLALLSCENCPACMACYNVSKNCFKCAPKTISA